MRTKLLNLILYSNLWIALGAVGLTWQTQVILLGEWEWFSPITGLAFCATLFIYAAHRIVGLDKVEAFTDKGRYKVISTYKSHIQIYAGLAVLGGAYCFFQLTWNTQFALIIPAVLSLGYVVPFLAQKKRLRDLDHIKIFLVALVWAWVTVLLPLIESGYNDYLAIALIFMERFCFIFAITLPFDIRDLEVDGHTGVRTIPSQIGVANARQLAYFLLFFSAVLAFTHYGPSMLEIRFALLLSLLAAAYLVYLAKPSQSDFFYTGLLDGTMILQPLLVLLASLQAG